MADGLIFPIVVLLFFIFIIVIPTILYRGLKRVASPIPLYLPPLLAAGIILVFTGIRSSIEAGNDVLIITVTYFSMMLLLTALAVINPYPFFEEKAGIDQPWLIFSLLTFIGAGLFFMTTLGETLAGMPEPAFSTILPATGWIFDIAAGALHLQEIVYASGSPFYEIIRAVGLYIEVFIVAGIFYAVLSLISLPDKKHSQK